MRCNVEMHSVTGTADALPCFLRATISYQGENKMFAKYMTAGLVASALFASVAFAQTPTTTTDRANMTPPSAASNSSFPGDWRASKLFGLTLYTANTETLCALNILLSH